MCVQLRESVIEYRWNLIEFSHRDQLYLCITHDDGKPLTLWHDFLSTVSWPPADQSAAGYAHCIPCGWEGKLVPVPAVPAELENAARHFFQLRFSPAWFWTLGPSWQGNAAAVGVKGDDRTVAHVLTQWSEITKRIHDEKSSFAVFLTRMWVWNQSSLTESILKVVLTAYPLMMASRCVTLQKFHQQIGVGGDKQTHHQRIYSIKHQYTRF